MTEVTLADLVEPGRKICYGIVQPGAAHADGIPILRVNNFGANGLSTDDVLRIDPTIAQKYPRSKLHGGELLVTLVGSVGQVAIAPTKLAGWNVARAVGVVPIADPVMTKWASYVLRSSPAQAFLGQRANTTVQTTVNLRDLALLPIPLLPRDELEAVIGVLSALDDKIELNRRMNETLEAQARALFRDWFVDFGPVKAKMAGDIPYLSPDLWSLFPNRLDDCGVPEGWHSEPALELFDIRIGRTPPRKETQHFLDGKLGVPWLSIKTMGGGDSFIFDTEESLTPDAVEAFRVPTVEKGTVLVSFKLTVGRVAIAGCEMATNEAIAHFNRTDRSPGTAFTYCYLNTFDYASLGSTSSIATAVNSKTIKGIPFLSGCPELQSSFEQLEGPVLKKIRANIVENKSLAQTRDLLLPKLMSGVIRVREAERQIEEAL